MNLGRYDDGDSLEKNFSEYYSIIVVTDCRRESSTMGSHLLRESLHQKLNRKIFLKCVVRRGSKSTSVIVFI